MRALVGALLWALFLLLTLLCFVREERRRLAEYRGLCRLLSHISASLAHAPTPLSVIYATFRDDALARAGFLSVLEERGLSSALSSGTLHIERGDLLPLFSYAEGLGGRLYAEEKQAAEKTHDLLLSALKEKEAALPVRERLTATLFFTGGGLLLLLLL